MANGVPHTDRKEAILTLPESTDSPEAPQLTNRRCKLNTLIRELAYPEV